MLKSIFSKYFWTIMTIILLSFLVLVLVITMVVNNYALRTKRALLTNAAQSSSDYIRSITDSSLSTNLAGLIDKRGKELTRMLDIVSSSGGDITLLVLDIDGNILDKRGTTSLLTGTIPRSIMNEVNSGMENFRLEPVDGVFAESMLCVASPIYTADGHICGTVLACSNSSTMDELLGVMIKTVIIGALWVVLAALIAVYIITKKLTEPLKQMSLAAKEFADGRFDTRVPVTGNDEISELATAFNNMADSISRLEVMRNTFMANVSHDLRTPMTTISGFIDNILSGAIPSSEHSHYLARIRAEVQRLARLVASLLDISRIQAGDRKFEMVPFDICEMARLILFSFEAKIEDKHLDVEFSCDEERLTVSADHDAIYQILYNITDNAVKFAREGGKLRVCLRAGEKGKVVVSVYNEGEGIAEADLPFVFERFYKGDKSRGLDKSGVGLGLFIAKTIIEAHHEKIQVESVEGEYCEFHFTLPRLSDQSTKPVKF